MERGHRGGAQEDGQDEGMEKDQKEFGSKGAKILSTTWAMKKKSNGVFRARINAQGFEQVDGEHYESHDIAAPVSNERSI